MCLLESEFCEFFLYFVARDCIAEGDAQGVLLHLCLRDYLFGYCFGVGYDYCAVLSAFARKAAHYFGAEYAVGFVLLSVSEGAPVGGGEEEYTLLAAYLHKVVIEITGLFGIIHYDEQCLSFVAFHIPRYDDGCAACGESAQLDSLFVLLAGKLREGFHSGV